MTIIGLPTPEKSTIERTWGARCGDNCYFAHVLVLPLGTMEPPRWMGFEFAEPAPELDVESTLVNPEVLAGIAAHPDFAALCCQVLDVELVETTVDDYSARALGAAKAAVEETIATATGLLHADDFAHPVQVAPPPRRRKRRR